jgi:uncharacterized protein
MGDWTTKSYGKVTDFNLMMADGCSGKLEALFLKDGECADMLLSEAKDDYTQITDAFYVSNGNISAALQDRKFELYEGELLILTRPVEEEGCKLSIYNKLEKEAKIIRSIIFY